MHYLHNIRNKRIWSHRFFLSFRLCSFDTFERLFRVGITTYPYSFWWVHHQQFMNVFNCVEKSEHDRLDRWFLTIIPMKRPSTIWRQQWNPLPDIASVFVEWRTISNLFRYGVVYSYIKRVSCQRFQMPTLLKSKAIFYRSDLSFSLCGHPLFLIANWDTNVSWQHDHWWWWCNQCTHRLVFR